MVKARMQNEDDNDWEMIGSNQNDGVAVPHPAQDDTIGNVVEIMMNLSMADIFTMEKKVAEIEKRLADLTFMKESFNEDNEKTKFYTGLPSYKIL